MSPEWLSMAPPIGRAIIIVETRINVEPQTRSRVFLILVLNFN